MLNGLDPVIIFQFSRTEPSALADIIAKIPVVSQIPTLIDEPPIPVYLSEEQTGLIIDSESKNIDISTETETKTDGSEPNVNQKGIANTTSINLIALRESIGLMLLSALSDVVFEKATSKEYSISYMHGPIIIFRGVVHSIGIDPDADTNKMLIKIQLSKGTKNPTKPASLPVVPSTTGGVPL